jgi:light-harvesting complex II chlorophyll a/b binding protein 4
LPFLPRPTALDGSHAGDYGFDPLGLSEKLDFYAMQESEVRHSRLAMLAAIGWPMSELLAPSWMLQDNGCAPSVLNGVNPLSFLAIAGFLGAAGYFEYKTSLRRTLSTPMGKMHEKDMSAIWKYGVAGDYNWDPMNLYSSCGDDYKGRKGLRDVELSHGRVAMLGITYFAAWEALTGHPIVENSMFFHPNLLLPLLVAGYAGWSQIYEVGPLNEYPIDIRYTNEGEMKLNRLQRGAQDVLDGVTSSAQVAKAQLDNLDSKFGIYEKVGTGGTNFVESVKSKYYENVVVGGRSDE